jgi:LPS sulfotransferase NodH
LWLEYFKKNEITPYVITYEELDELPYETLCDVLTFLEQPPVSRNEFDAIYADIPFERQANMTTVEWLERWRVSSSKEGWKP